MTTRDLPASKAIDLLLAAKWHGCPLEHDSRLGYSFASITVDQHGLPVKVRTRNVRGLVAYVDAWLANEPAPEKWNFQIERNAS